MTRHARARCWCLLGVLVLAGCDAGRAPSSARSSSAAPISSQAGSSSAVEGTPAAGQTDTDWGRIWDNLPTGFPIYPGAAPDDGASREAVSRSFAVADVGAGAVATWMQAALERARFETEGLNGPFEDGGYVLESVGPGGCRVQVRTAPLGAFVSLSVRYGAACPVPG